MESITSDTRWSEICEKGEGFVFNDFAGKGISGIQENVLHRADCYHLKRASTVVEKSFSLDLDEMIEWLDMFRKGNWKSCGSCCRNIQLTVGQHNTN